MVTGTQQGWPSAAPCSAFLGLAPNDAAGMCEEGGKLEKPGDTQGSGAVVPGPHAAVTAGRPPGPHGAGVSSQHTLTISGLPQRRAMPGLPPGRKSLAVTPCFKHSLVKAFPWQTALQWSLPSLQCSRALSSLLHLLHLLHSLSLLSLTPAMGNPSCLAGISSSSLISVDPSLSPLPGHRRGRIAAPLRPEPGFPRQGRGCCLSPGLSTLRERAGGARSIRRARDSEPWAMFSPAAARREVPLSLPTSLSPAVPGLISAWHLERRTAPRRQHPAAFCCYFSNLRHNLFFFFSPIKRLLSSAPHGEDESPPLPRWPRGCCWGGPQGPCRAHLCAPVLGMAHT